MKDTKTFAYRMGQILASVVIGCIAVCLIAILLALTGRVLSWLFLI